MSPVRGLTSAMQPFSRCRGSKPLAAADTERLLAGRGVHPKAPAVQHALAGLLDSAAGPASDQELTGEAAAVATFMLVTGEHAARSAQFRARARRGPAIAVGIAAAVVVAFSGAAAADALPGPIQELAHTTFGAPAPQHPAPLPKATSPSSQPAPAASPSPKSQHGKAKALGRKASPSGPAPGKAKRKAVPPGPSEGLSPSLPVGRRTSRSRTHVAWRSRASVPAGTGVSRDAAWGEARSKTAVPTDLVTPAWAAGNGGRDQGTSTGLTHWGGQAPLGPARLPMPRSESWVPDA
jgi:hypothetical protein